MAKIAVQQYYALSLRFSIEEVTGDGHCNWQAISLVLLIRMLTVSIVQRIVKADRQIGRHGYCFDQ